MNNTLRKVARLGAFVTSLILIGSPAFSQPITAVLKLKEKIPMEVLAQNVRGPFSPRYGRPYSPEEIRDLAGPGEGDYAHLLSVLRQAGFEIIHESATRLLVTVRADSRLFEKLFGAKIESRGRFRRNLRAAAPVPVFPLVQTVIGMDNTRRSHPLFIRRGNLTPTPQGIPQATIKSSYNFDPIYQSGITGAGQDIAVATYDGFHIDDVKTFYSLSGLKPGPAVDQVTFNGTPALNEDSAVETELDAEFSGMMAPGAKVHVFASATNDDAGELQMFTAILDDNRAKVVNYSWGDCENHLQSAHQQEMEKIFARAVAQGVNIMVASGDSGSDGCQDGTVDADWPAANPDVVAVGGTTFGGQAGSGPNETAWSGSGGGISGLFNLPVWQQPLGAPYTRRSFPDVAFNADPNSGEAIYTRQNGQTGWMVIGGTSMAAPQWSGFLALVGQARGAAGKTPLGFLNPIIYGLSSPQKEAVFHDVTSGSNGAFHAGPGWDAVTGLGSMNAAQLLNLLTGI